MIKVLFICHGSDRRILQGAEFIRGMRLGDLFLYDRFVTLVKMAILSVAWQMNMWGVKKWQSKNGCKIWKSREGQFQGGGR